MRRWLSSIRTRDTSESVASVGRFKPPMESMETLVTEITGDAKFSCGKSLNHENTLTAAESENLRHSHWLEFQWRRFIAEIDESDYKPDFSKEWWPYLDVASPSEGALLRLVTLSGHKSSISRQFFWPKNDSSQDIERKLGQTSAYFQILRNAMEARTIERDGSLIRLARNLSWRVLNLRVRIRRAHLIISDKTCGQFGSESTPLLLSVMVLQALKTLSLLAHRGLLEWDSITDQQSSNSLVVEEASLSGSALLIPPVRHITRREVWALFSELAEDLAALGHVNGHRSDSLDETRLLFPLVLRADMETERLTKCATITQWLELLRSVAPLGPVRLGPHINCVELVVVWFSNLDAPGYDALPYINCLLSLTRDLSRPLKDITEMSKSACKCAPSVIADQHLVWSMRVCRNILNLINGCLYHALHINTPRKSCSPTRAYQSTFLHAATEFSDFLRLIFLVQTKLCLPRDDFLRGSALTNIGHSKRQVLPLARLQQTISKSEARELLSCFITFGAKISDLRTEYVRSDMKCLHTAILRLMTAGLRATRCRVNSTDLITRLAPNVHRLTAMFPNIREVACKEKLTLQNILTIIALSTITLTIYYIQLTRFTGHWMTWLPEFEDEIIQ